LARNSRHELFVTSVSDTVDLLKLLSERLPQFSLWRCAAALFGILLSVVFFLPRTSLISALVTIATVIGSLGAVLCGLTFWAKARVQIGRLKFRYRAVRRWAGVTALIFLSFSAMQRVALRVWNLDQPAKSSIAPASAATSAAAQVAPSATGRSLSPEEQSRDESLRQASQRKCCNFEGCDGGRPERNWAARSQAARSNSWSMN
jgi:hypothetical protein